LSEVKKGTTSRTEYFNLVDKTAGTAKTGVTPTNLYLAYTRTRSSTVASVCTSLGNSASSWLSNGAIEVDATNAPGLYRVDVPDAAYSSNANVDTVVLTLIATTTSSVAPAMKEVQLVTNIMSDFSSLAALSSIASVIGNVGGSVASVVGNVGGSVGSVSGGVTGSVGSVVGNVGGSVGSVLNTVTAAVSSLSAAALGDFFDTNSGSTAGAAVSGSVVFEIVNNAGGTGLTAAAIADAVWDETVAAHTLAGSFGKSLADTQSNTSVIGAAGAGLTAIPRVGSVTGNVGGSVGSVVGGVGGAVAGSVGSVVGNVGGSVGSVVGNVGGSVNSVATAVLASSVQGNVGGSVGSVVGNVGGSVNSVATAVLASSVTGNVGGSVGSVVGNVGGSVNSVATTVTANATTVGDKTGYSTVDFTTAMAESYRANGATGTPAQVLYEILSHLTEKVVSGTTMTTKKLDHSAVATTLTLDATTPSSVSRAS